MARRKATEANPPLSRATVVSAALDEIDENGLAAFSLRALAKRLGVYPSSIYWYVLNREELLAEVLGQALLNSTPEEQQADWRDSIRVMFERFRESIRRHPNIAPLLASNLMVNVSLDFEFAERPLAALRAAGFEGEGLVAAFNLVMSTLMGFAPQEFSPAPSEANEEWKDQMEQRLAVVSDDAYPVLAANIDRLRNRAFFLRWRNGADAPFDASYPIVVEILIAGLEAAGAKARG